MKFASLLVFFVVAVTIHGEEREYDASSLPPEIAKLLQDPDLLQWKPPKFLSDNYRYYWSGYDYEERPVWILEWGRWDMRKIIEEGLQKDFEKFNSQMYANIAQSLVNATKEGDPVTNSMTVIIDMEGFKAEQITSRQTLAYILRMFREFLPILSHVGERTYLINAHFVIETLLTLLKPILGEVLEQVQIFGTDKAKWQAALLRDIPVKSLPEWYGGSKKWVPVGIYG